MRQAGSGSIINVSSISARTGGSPGSSIYSGAKAFVSTFTRSLARELAPHKVRVNALSPGTIATAFHERHSTPEKLEGTRKTIPMARLGTAQDCAGTALVPRLRRFVGLCDRPGDRGEWRAIHGLIARHSRASSERVVDRVPGFIGSLADFISRFADFIAGFVGSVGSTLADLVGFLADFLADLIVVVRGAGDAGIVDRAGANSSRRRY